MAKLELRATDLDIEITEARAADGRHRRHHDRARAHALRNRAQALRRRRGAARDRRQRADAASPPAARASISRACRRTLSRICKSGSLQPHLLAPRRDAARADRARPSSPSPTRRRATTSTASISTPSTSGKNADSARRRHRRSPHGTRRNRSARRRQGYARHHHPEKDRRRSAEAARWRRAAMSRSKSCDTKIRFAVGGVVLFSKLIEGTFPDYERVTPKNNDKQLSVDRADLRRPPSIASRPSRPSAAARPKLSRQGRPARALPSPTRTTAPPAKNSPSPSNRKPFEIGFNARYLLDIVGQIRSRQRHLPASTIPGSPTLVHEKTAKPKRPLRADADAGVTPSMRRDAHRWPRRDTSPGAYVFFIPAAMLFRCNLPFRRLPRISMAGAS